MPQLEDLDDDSLIEVLDRLPLKELLKMLRVNKNINRLASVKLRVKDKAIAFRLRNDSAFISECTHLDAGRRNQVFVLNVFNLREYFQKIDILESPSQKALFFGLISRCCNVKSVDFTNCKLPGDVLLEVVRRCEQIECIKVGQSLVEEENWNRVLDQVGHRIVHFAKNEGIDIYSKIILPEVCLLNMVASKCPNIKRVDWVKDAKSLSLKSALDLLPESCWVKLTSNNGFNNYGDFEDVDDLCVYKLNLSSLGQRIDRLSSLTCRGLTSSDGVFFANLKKFEFNLDREAVTVVNFLP